MAPFFFFFGRAFLTAVCSPQVLRIPLGSEWEPAWLRMVNQPEHFAQRRAICLPCLAGAAPHIAEQGGSDCVLLRAAQQCPPPALPAGPASLAERRGSSRGANPQQVTDEVTTFCGPAPSNFTGQDDETLGPGAKEFWISVPFSPPRRDERRTILTGSAGLWVAICSEWRNQGDIAAKSRAVPGCPIHHEI